MSLKDKLRNAAQITRQAFALARPYFVSEEKVRAWGLLVAIIALNLGAVFMLVQFNEWNRVFYDALQEKQADVFWRQLAKFSWLAAIYIVIAVYKFYLTQLLQLNWRKWLTQQMLTRWLAAKAFYRLELGRLDGSNVPDNPDQRIQEDLNLFTTYTVSLAMGLLNALVTFVSFVGILWGLSGVMDVHVPQALGGGTWEIAGFMVWMAVLYCIIGTIITFWVGAPQVLLNNRQQRFEANFRRYMIRVREHAEAIALDGGERVEGGRLTERLGDVLGNYLALIRKQKSLIWFTTFFAQAAVVFPFLIAAPRFFSGAIQLGQLMQIASAFGQVSDSLSWIVNNYQDIAAWRATTQRLAGFDESLAQQSAHRTDGARLENADHLETEGLQVALPRGEVILSNAALKINARERVLISGASGSGKSTLMRVFAGIWPFAKGRIERPQDAMFIPQRPYFPDGSLREALAYPEPASRYGDEQLVQALEQASLPRLVARMDEKNVWNAVLSGGEQQRLAIARVLLKRPAWVFADEATSALDGPTEAHVYDQLAQLVQERDGALISIAHRDSVQRFHNRNWKLDPQSQSIAEQPGQAVG
ncbi:ABC transporter ATP-binding protein/permease [Diaphorobacter aerolatus]|uniref:ABC transporter ATP-binding protein/permease n=1 Tax=Diaphorobacter aerolatus TaxID=1288495 RepID=A0A7H0GI74_9BURK|nr:ABC transporter ATP-binding protein/permease [Diaphorobacter aerolatus]QNP47990.1 ABC transporter ATP-binding protein/permease [Diaphorobacter aerolatus]